MDNILNNLDLSSLDSLTPRERELALSILKEYSETGESKQLTELKLEDYAEVPVDITTFLHDTDYLGKGLTTDEGKFTVFPYWEKMLKQLFPDNISTAYNTLILSGAIGLGKSFIAVIAMLYMLYRMLCLKDPYKHFGLQPIDHITFSIMNITLDAAKGVAWSKIQELLQLSPWFMAHGRVSRAQNPEWQPNQNIELIYGSQPRHVIGRAVYCLDGDTEIITPSGIIKLQDAVEKDIQVYSYSDNGQVIISDICKVQPTIKTSDYYEIELEDGSIVRCTSNHKFLLIDGTYKAAEDLTEDDELLDLKTTSLNEINYSEAETKIKKITHVVSNDAIQFYDVVEAKPYHNFLIKTQHGAIISHNCSFEDEISFQLNSDVEKQKKKAKELISSIDARMSSRFMKGEKLPTLHILASSKRTDQSFLETYIDTKKKNESKTTLIIDEPQWVIRTDKDSPNKFAVAVGNKFLDSEVLPLSATEDDYQIYRDKGYSILMVPMGYHEQFLDDINIALTDIAGISTSNSTSYISGVRWTKCRNDSLQNPFTREILEIGNGPDDKSQYYDFFDLSLIPRDIKSKPLFIHLDMSMSGDKTGIAGVFIKGKKPHEEGIPDSKELYFQLGFSVSIKAPKGRQVSFEKNRQFIYWLREQGFNIKGVSMDTFQSADLFQQLQSHGFKCSIISVDRVKDRICPPYQTFKNAIYEERLITYKTKLLTAEVIGLIRDGNGKIDHSPAGINCFTGDTKIQLVDGRSISILDLKSEFESGKKNYVYSINETKHKIEPKLIENVFCSGKNAKLMQVTLDNGERIRCTPEHRFMLRNGTYIEAQDLVPNDSLMPLYLKYLEHGDLINYRLYYEPFEDAWHYEHRSFAYMVYDEKYLVHHIDCNPKNNNPSNLIWCSKSAHQCIHARMETGAHSPEAELKRSISIQNYHAKNKADPDYWTRYYPELSGQEAYEQHNINELKLADKKSKHQDKIQKINQLFQIDYESLAKDLQRSYMSKYDDYIRGFNINFDSQTDSEINKKRIHEIELCYNVDFSNLSETERHHYSMLYARNYTEAYNNISQKIAANHSAGKYENAKKTLQANNLKLKMLKAMFPEIDKMRFFEIFGITYDDIPSSQKGAYANRYRQKLYELQNHKVTSIEYIDEREDVFDITVQDNHNFALSAGIFVHNSKDQCDAVCGSTYAASLHAEEFAYDYGESSEQLLRANEDTNSDDVKQIALNLEEELKQMHGLLSPGNSKRVHPSDFSEKTSNYSLYDDIIIL